MKFNKIITIKNKVFPNFFGHGLFVIKWAQVFYLKKYVKKYDSQIGKTVIDLGAGISPYKKIFDRDRKYYTFDFPSASDSAQNNDFKPDFEGDLSKRVDLNRKFDFALCLEVLEHVSDPNQVFENLNRLLNKGSLCIVSAPFLYTSHDVPYNYFHYTKFGLFELANKNNFEVLEYGSKGCGIVTILSVIYNGSRDLVAIPLTMFSKLILRKEKSFLFFNDLTEFFLIFVNILLLPIQLIVLLEIIGFNFMKNRFGNSALFKKYELLMRDKQTVGHNILIRKK